MLVLLSYIWCDEYWMRAYNVRDYAATAENIPRIVRFHFASVGAWRCADCSCDCVSKVFVECARRFPLILPLSRLCIADSMSGAFPHGSAIH